MTQASLGLPSWGPVMGCLFQVDSREIPRRSGSSYKSLGEWSEGGWDRWLKHEGDKELGVAHEACSMESGSYPPLFMRVIKGLPDWEIYLFPHKANRNPSGWDPGAVSSWGSGLERGWVSLPQS